MLGERGWREKKCRSHGKSVAAALDKTLDDPGVAAKLAELGGSIPPKSERTPAKFDSFVKAEIARWSPILKAATVGEK